MFAVPGFSVGNLVVEGSKEQLKKRKADAITAPSSSTTTAAAITNTTATTTSTTTSTSTSSSSSVAAVLPIATSTSNAPFSKKFKKDPVFEKRPPSEPKLGWGWIPEPVPLKERATWNQSTKALRKAKAEEERAKKAKALEDKKQLVSSISGPSNAVELLLKGSVDLTDIAAMGGKKNKGGKENKKDGQDVEMEDASGAEPKKRNKRLERKIKRAAYIAAMEANKSDDTTEATTVAPTQETNNDAQDVSGETEGGAENNGGEEESADGKKKKGKKPKILQAPAPKHPELAKLTNKEKRLLKQLQKKQQAEGIDPIAIVVKQQPLNPSNKRISGQSASDQSTLEAFQAATAAAEEKIMAGLVPKSKKDKKAEKKAAAAVVEETKPVESEKPAKEKKDKKDNNKADSAALKKQQQLAKEREKLLEALARTNSALEELQESLGDEGEDAAPLAKKDVKSAVQDKKKNNKKEEAAPTATKKEKKATPTPAPAPAPAAPAAKQPKLTKLQEQMKKTLAGGKFRFLNEQLYTTTGEEAFDLFQSKPELFDEYHEGFRSQVESWPQNP
ncbi:25S rRNA (adenine645-N1)-methyltransferase, partial [Linnemannia schmuckeri]